MNKGALWRWIQEFLQIQVHHPAVSFGDILLRRSHRLMCRALGSKPIAVLGKRPIPPALQNLHHRLLDKSIQHCRDGQRELHLSTASIWDGPRSVTHSIRCVVNVSPYSRSDASLAMTL
jgi:hypothetical protein